MKEMMEITKNGIQYTFEAFVGDITCEGCKARTDCEKNSPNWMCSVFNMKYGQPHHCTKKEEL